MFIADASKRRRTPNVNFGPPIIAEAITADHRSQAARTATLPVAPPGQAKYSSLV